jgi:hypothetical protein
MTNRNISESLAQLASIAPVAQTAGTVLSGPFTLNPSRKAMATILVGTPGSGGTVDAKIRWSATSGGTYADVTGAAMAQMVAAGSQQIEIRGDRVNALAQGPWFKLSVTVAVATTPIAAIVQGADSRDEPNSDHNEAAVLTAAVVV